MDLQSLVANKKKQLKSTKTIVTNYLGEKFEISDGVSTKLNIKGSSFVVDDKPDLRIDEIIPGLFLSSQDPVVCLDLLLKNNIKCILSLGIEPSIKFPSVSYHFIEILDVPEFQISSSLVQCFSIIDSHLGDGVLVHCNAGVSRSPTVIIAYLMVKRNYSYDHAYETVKKVRACVRPNDGFVHQLANLDRNRFLVV